MIIDMIKKNDVEGIMNIDDVMRENAGEWGYRSIVMLMGALKGLNVTPEILSYEGPFGVGYLVAAFNVK
jgi:MEMO1 family protein